MLLFPLMIQTVLGLTKRSNKPASTISIYYCSFYKIANLSRQWYMSQYSKLVSLWRIARHVDVQKSSYPSVVFQNQNGWIDYSVTFIFSCDSISRSDLVTNFVRSYGPGTFFHRLQLCQDLRVTDRFKFENVHDHFKQ